MTAALPAGPRRPAFAQTLEWILDPERFMSRCAREFGPTFTARLGPGADVVFVSEPAAVKAVFHGGGNMGDINGLFRRVLGHNSLLVIDGPEHLRQRKLLLPPFHGERVAEHHEAMIEAAEEDVAGWPVGEPMALQAHMQAMTLSVILGAVFGLKAGSRRDRFRVLLARLLELNTTIATTLPQLRRELGGRSPWGRLMRCTAEVDREVYAEIERRRALEGERPNDVLSLLLEAQEDGDQLTDRELRDQLLTMLVAGHETTATALAWAFERLVRHPDALDQIVAEMEQGDGTAYIDAAIKETLRLRPVVPITARKLTEAFEVDGREYTPGTVLMPCIFLLHRNPHIYDRPHEFRPERWLNWQPPAYGYIPFGGGVRRCLGAGFAHAEMRAVIRTVLSRVHLGASTRASEKIARRAFTLSPKDGARVLVTARR